MMKKYDLELYKYEIEVKLEPWIEWTEQNKVTHYEIASRFPELMSVPECDIGVDTLEIERKWTWYLI